MLLCDRKAMVSPSGGQDSGQPYNNDLATTFDDHIGKPGGQVLQNDSSSSSPPPPGAAAAASYFLGNNDQSVALQQQQLTLGETTLEEFLLRAGVINNHNATTSCSNDNFNQNGVAINQHHDQQTFMGIDPMVVVTHQQADWLQFQMTPPHHHHLGMMDASHFNNINNNNNENVSESSVYETNPVGDHTAYPSENHHQLGLTVPAPSESRVNSNNVERKRRYYSDEVMEKTIERKQKRMIKNRESAARSRARKQAYTDQLKSEVSRLTKRNCCLKKQKEVEILLSSYPAPMSKYQLRRVSSV